MTVVHIDLRGADDLPVVSGSVLFSPTRRLHIDDDVDDHIILPIPFIVDLVEGEADVELMPTEANVWAWSVIERVKKGIRRYVTVPDTTDVLDYGDLLDVDPTTLQPYEPTSTIGQLLAGKITGIGITHAVKMTETAYTLLPVKDPATLYVLTD